MVRIRKLMSKKQGLPPGALMHIGDQTGIKPEVYLFEYDKADLKELNIDDVSSQEPDYDDGHVKWLNINGLADVEIIEEIGKKFDIHHLILEDIVNTAQRPKMDDYFDCLYLTVKMVDCSKEGFGITEEQVSMLLVKNWVITFQERPGDVFEPVRSRLRNNRGRVRALGADYLFYALLDCIVDNYFFVLEQLEDRIDVLNDDVGTRPDKRVLSDIHEIKSEVNYLKRAVWPLRELTSDIIKNEAGFLSQDVIPYLGDIDDHVKQIIDVVSDAREAVTGLFDLYASTIGNNMNQIMKVLTIMSAVFIPMSFIAGLYGMNFSNMPELQWHYGYYTALGVMASIATFMLVVFKMKKWW